MFGLRWSIKHTAPAVVCQEMLSVGAVVLVFVVVAQGGGLPASFRLTAPQIIRQV